VPGRQGDGPEGPAKEVLERRIVEVNGSGPLFWKITPGDDYPRQLKDANRELRELTGLKRRSLC
jgi:hypothetical protein